MIGTIIGAIILGAIVGGLGRLILPGKQSLSVPKTIGIGIVANLIVSLVLSGAGTIIALIVGTIVAVGVMFLAEKKGLLGM